MEIATLRQAILISALIFSCLGCQVTSERSIVGTYRAEAPCETIILELNRDHTFIQSVRTHSGEINRLKGRWWLDKSDNIVMFDHFLDFLNDGRGDRGGGGTGFKAERMPRGITMGPIIVKCPDSDHEIDYIK
jgi:hypothetical protein